MRPKEPSIPPATEQRLLESAGEVFAEKGFRAATIRDIIRRAGANIAAVNYHFGDKEKLYAAVFRYARQCCQEKYPVGSPEGVSTREKLHTFVRSLLFRMLDHGRPAWQWKLMAREMMEPTAALDEMVEQTIKPEFEFISQIVRDLTGLPRGDGRVPLCVNSVIGQVLFYRHAQAVVNRLQPEQKFEPKDLEALANHITDFSCRTLEGSKKGASSKKGAITHLSPTGSAPRRKERPR
jgi:AcrR family transcriptional regulator